MKKSKASPVLCNCSAYMTAGMIAEITGQKVKVSVTMQATAALKVVPVCGFCRKFVATRY